jgi:hypothetical protein
MLLTVIVSLLVDASPISSLSSMSSSTSSDWEVTRRVVLLVDIECCLMMGVVFLSLFMKDDVGVGGSVGLSF